VSALARAAATLPPLLVVDDEERMRVLLTHTLATRARGTIAAAGADEAVELVRALRLAGVVSDYRMAPRDGLELLAEVRAVRPALPFVLVSASFDAGVPERGLRAGASLVLEKREVLDDPELVWRTLERPPARLAAVR
jgi:CheY-like chemotaxis protein